MPHSVSLISTIAAGLAQIGEFSFILIGLGASLGLLPPEGQSLVLAGALISIALNPVIETVVRTHSETEARLLNEEQAGRVFLGEHELAQAMVRHVVERTATDGGRGAAAQRCMPERSRLTSSSLTAPA